MPERSLLPLPEQYTFQICQKHFRVDNTVYIHSLMVIPPPTLNQLEYPLTRTLLDIVNSECVSRHNRALGSASCSISLSTHSSFTISGRVLVRVL